MTFATALATSHVSVPTTYRLHVTAAQQGPVAQLVRAPS